MLPDRSFGGSIAKVRAYRNRGRCAIRLVHAFGSISEPRELERVLRLFPKRAGELGNPDLLFEASDLGMDDAYVMVGYTVWCRLSTEFTEDAHCCC